MLKRTGSRLGQIHENHLPAAHRGSGQTLRAGSFVVGLFAVLAAGNPLPATAGPPFLTDDPEPVDYGHWEIIGFSMGTSVQGDAAGSLPGVEVNYGALPN